MKTSLRRASPDVLYRPIMLACMGLSFLMFGLPIYAKAIGASPVEIGGLYTIFTLALLLSRPLVGWGLDRFGRRSFLIAGLGLYALAMALFGLAQNLPGFYAARLINGLASGLTWTTTATIVADLTERQERGKIMGRVNEMDMRGELMGVFFGFLLITNLPVQTAWEITFLSFAGMAAAGTWLAWKWVPESRPAEASATQRSSRVRLSRPFLWLLAIVLTTAFAQASTSPLYLIYLQDRFTTEIETLAFAFLPAGLLLAILPSRLGKLSDRFGRAPFMALGLLGSGVLSLSLPLLPNLTWLVVVYTLTGVGWAMSVPAEAALVADLTGREERGRMYGLYQFMGSLGAGLGPLVGTWLYQAVGQAVPFFANGAVLLAGAVWVLFALNKRALAGTVPQSVE